MNLNEPRLRLAVADDAPFLRRMQWESILASPSFLASRGVEALQAIEAEYWSRWPTPDATAFVAETATGERLGAAIVKVHQRDADRVVGYRLMLAIEANVRRQGIGRRLIDHAKRFVEASGADYLLLLVDTTNQAAVATYHATGFALGDADRVVPMTVHFTRRSSTDCRDLQPDDENRVSGVGC